MRVGLIACSKGKLEHAAPAAELYTGPLFRLCREWISTRRGCEVWAILSAKHGLVMPGDVLEPYECALSAMPAAERDRWAASTREQIQARWGSQPIYTVLAGSNYTAALRGFPFVENVIADWTRHRRERGMSPRQAAIGIGVLKRLVKAQLA